MASAAKYVVAALIAIAVGCGSGVDQRGSAPVQTAAERPVALVRLARFAVGSPGKISGYVRGWPTGEQDLFGNASRPHFTYVIDFQIVEISQYNGIPVRAKGVRRVYFHPSGARVTFGDASSFVEGEPIAVEQVRFTFEFLPGFSQIKLAMRVHQTSARRFEYGGRTITPAMEHDDAFDMFGRFSPQYDGFLMRSTGT